MKLLKVSFILVSLCLYTQYVIAQSSEMYDLTAQEDALLTAAQQGNLDKVKELVNAGVNINIKVDHIGNSALHFAAQRGNLPVVKFLVEKGADINAQNNFYATPLAEAKRLNQAEVANYLKSKGAQ